ncbi:MAG TPA: AtpZ/AtpI family protein [Puia sp.]|nr:AtpZ/AtpI family protein [Puia sp.]
MPKSQPADQNNHKRFDGGGAEGRRQLMRYAGLSGQLAASVGVAVWLGIKADKWLKLSFPIFSLVVPLVVIVFFLVQIIKANSGKKDEK